MAADLHKQPEQKSLLDVYAPYILILLIIILILLIVAVVMVMTGVHANSITGSEANIYQNLEAII